MPKLTGRVALVTGAARGIGAAIADAVVAEGGQVVIADVLGDEGRETADRLGADAMFVHLDVTDRAAWLDAVASTERRFGRLDVLVNNAAITLTAPIDTYRDEDFDRIMAVNVGGVFNGIKAVIPAMRRAGGGSIVNFSSVAGLMGFQYSSGYVASKFAVRGLTKAAAIDLVPDRIRVNSVHPGYVNTPMTAGAPVDPAKVNLMGRAGEPAELARLVIFLASDDSSYSTGAEFIADGGESAGVRHFD
jgi:3alpha(or 20beta)-hydroxysteroid dehydrogenase